MANTTNAQTVEKNQRTILNSTTKKKFVEAVDHFGRRIYERNGKVYMTVDVERGVAMFVRNLPFYSAWDKYNYLKRAIPDFNPKTYLDKDGDVKPNAENTFDKMMVRDGVKLYRQIKKNHPDW